MLKRNQRNNRHFWWNFNWGAPAPPSWLCLCPKWGKQNRCLQIFREVSGVFQRNFNCSKNSAALEPRTGQFSRTWDFEAKAKGKDFKMCPRGRPRGQGRPRGLHLCSARPIVFLGRCRLLCAVKTCTSLFGWGLLRLKRRIASREDVQPTDSFILKQSFRLFYIDFHLSVDQSLTVLTQLACGTVTKDSGPCIFDFDPNLATWSATSLPWIPACLGIQAILTWLGFVYLFWFRFLMHLSTVIDVTMHFMNDFIAAWLSITTKLFWLCIFSQSRFFVTSEIAKTSAWNTVL